MLGHAREGKMRAKLREAILAGFDPAALDQILRDNDMFRHNVAVGPDFATRVNSLINIAHQEGWLAQLCGVLAEARAGNQRVNSAIVAVQKWLIEQSDNNEIDFQFQQDLNFTGATRPGSRRHSSSKSPMLCGPAGLFRPNLNC